MIVHGDWRGTTLAAIVEGKQIRDLFIEPAHRPNLTGGIARAAVTQVKAGGLTCFVDLPDSAKGYLQSKTPRKTGEILTVEVSGWPTGDKAWPVKRLAQPADGEGWLTPPPGVLQRAQALLPKAKAQQLDENALDDLLSPLLATHIPFGNGSSITLSATPALLAIDVDSGGNGNYSSVNREAARLIAAALRSRNLAGQVVIDFCRDRPGRAALIDYLGTLLAADPLPVTLHGQTKMGLVELSRPRQGPSLWEAIDADAE